MMMRHRMFRNASIQVVRNAVKSMSTEVTSHATLSPEMMKSDKRYQTDSPVPDDIVNNMFSKDSHGFSIQGEALKGRPAYMDFQATTPQDPRVLDAMLPFMTGRYGNPHSKTHSFGWETESAVEEAREQVANLIGASAKEIVFTSGATESNNMAIKGLNPSYISFSFPTNVLNCSLFSWLLFLLYSPYSSV